MFFQLKNRNKKIKELRKDRSLTAKELANLTGIDTTEILKLDNQMLKEITESEKSKLLPILRGDYLD